MFMVVLRRALPAIRICGMEWHDDRWMMNWTEFGRKRSVLSGHSPRGIEETHENCGIASVSAEIRTEHLSNISLTSTANYFAIVIFIS
jgi:hypothetical protein